ncbi:chorion class CA protein ERA.1-like [Galleria mellonella]|uniref:Chorion class CA protein ERA.1-like n=1 Tax=Galleria mellonella TaxID=7137 RepID=A0A6J1WLY8_GALME|nr:chorion class CA protein ERA.1-like [Galleria mellonella]
MSTFSFLLLCIQACLLQNVYSNPIGPWGPGYGNIGYGAVTEVETTTIEVDSVNRGGWGYGGLAPGYGFPGGYGLGGGVAVGAVAEIDKFAGIGNLGYGLPGAGLAPGLGRYGWEAEYGLAGLGANIGAIGVERVGLGAIGLPAPPVPVAKTGYGGVGNGVFEVFAEMPATGTAILGGQVPVLGAVEFAGILPATGAVTITGNCGCGLGYGLY